MPTRMTAIMMMFLLLIVLSGMVTPARALGVVLGGEPSRVTLRIVEARATKKTLEIRYRIANNSARDIWICESIIAGASLGPYFEVYLPDDSDTLTVRRRLNLPDTGSKEWVLPPDGLYLRVPPREQRSERIVLPLPVRAALVWFDGKRPEGSRYATHLRIEIGFHESDLPQRILEAISDSPQMLTRRNEVVRDRDHAILFSHNRRYIEDEQVLSAVAEVSRIPCVGETFASQVHGTAPPDLLTCTRIEVKYHPSMLDYFFPGAGEQSLLSLEEKGYLESQKTTLVDRPQQIASLHADIGRGDWSLVVAEETRAHVTGYLNDEVLASFSIFGDERVLIDNGLQFTYARPLTCLRTLAPQIGPYELRVECARRLKNLWYRFRVLRRAKYTAPADGPSKSVISYPPAARWTDALVETYRWTGVEIPTRIPYRCPSAGKGECHYAMNPRCGPDSAADSVLLFETREGWNQHGGPELFTFDNHDPKGGLVLLNDGTVKFIRTEEELKQLRWK